jgi:hypothetical protein
MLIAYERVPFGPCHNYLSTECDGVTQLADSLVGNPAFLFMGFIFTI